MSDRPTIGKPERQYIRVNGREEPDNYVDFYPTDAVEVFAAEVEDYATDMEAENKRLRDLLENAWPHIPDGCQLDKDVTAIVRPHHIVQETSHE